MRLPTIVEVELKKLGIRAFVRVQDKNAESTTFDITFSEAVTESALSSLARETFGSGYSTSQYNIVIKLKETNHKKSCEILSAFLKKLDDRLYEVSLLPWSPRKEGNK